MGSIRATSYYEKVNGNTWSLAESAAIALGGHLVTINDSSENAWLINNFATSNTGIPGLFIGFSDNATEGQWTWSSGETSLLQNGGAEDFQCPINISWLDSPSYTLGQAITYKLYYRSDKTNNKLNGHRTGTQVFQTFEVTT